MTSLAIFSISSNSTGTPHGWGITAMNGGMTKLADKPRMLPIILGMIPKTPGLALRRLKPYTIVRDNPLHPYDTHGIRIPTNGIICKRPFIHAMKGIVSPKVFYCSMLVMESGIIRLKQKWPTLVTRRICQKKTSSNGQMTNGGSTRATNHTTMMMRKLNSAVRLRELGTRARNYPSRISTITTLVIPRPASLPSRTTMVHRCRAVR